MYAYLLQWSWRFKDSRGELNSMMRGFGICVSRTKSGVRCLCEPFWFWRCVNLWHQTCHRIDNCRYLVNFFKLKPKAFPRCFKDIYIWRWHCITRAREKYIKLTTKVNSDGGCAAFIPGATFFPVGWPNVTTSPSVKDCSPSTYDHLLDCYQQQHKTYTSENKHTF